MHLPGVPHLHVNRPLIDLRKTHFPQGIAVSLLYPPVVPFFVTPILYPLNILLFGEVPTRERFGKWKVWCNFQCQSFFPIIVYNRSLIENVKR